VTEAISRICKIRISTITISILKILNGVWCYGFVSDIDNFSQKILKKKIKEIFTKKLSFKNSALKKILHISEKTDKVRIKKKISNKI